MWLPAAAGILLCAAAVPGCRGPEPTVEGHRKERELSLENFRELVESGTLRPVAAMDDQAFEEAEEDSPFEAFPFRDPQDVALESDRKTPEPEQPLPPAPVVPPPNPYLEFGDRIIVYPDGRIAKMYPLRSGTGLKMQELLLTYAPFPIWTSADVESGDASGPDASGRVRIDLHEGWDIELVSDLRQTVPDEGKSLKLADWLVAVARPDLLREVEDFINTFAAGVPQIEIEAKIVEVTTTESLDTGVSQVDPDTPLLGFGDNTFVRNLSWDFGVRGSAALATIGSIQDGFALNAVLEALATYENVSIISRPKVAVREGGRAQIVNTTEVPFFNITGINSANGTFGASLTFKEVGVQLFVVPRVVGTEAVALNIDIEVSQQSGTAVTFVTGQNEQIANPIISKRRASTIVYLEPGQAVILGGLITERIVDSEEKVPFLGDIPLLGYLFKSTSKLKEQSNVLFFIRPRILQGADVNRDF